MVDKYLYWYCINAFRRQRMTFLRARDLEPKSHADDSEEYDDILWSQL